MSTWLLVATIVLLFGIIIEIARLIPELLRGLRFESDFVLPDSDPYCRETHLVSVIVPAKDEGANIVESAESILASTYTRLELILINDRSSDETLELMKRISERDDRVRIVDIQTLPDNWTGKTHAMWVGAGMASGDIFLFTDADAVFSEDLIARTVKYFSTEHLDMLGFIPGFQKWGFLEKAIYPHMALGISYFFPLKSINETNSDAAVASGCFIMMSEKTYKEIGTWRQFRNQLTEDIAMSRAVKTLGKKICVTRSHMVRTKPFENILDLARFWRRTFYGALDNNLIKILRLWLNYTPLLIPFGIAFYFGFGILTGEKLDSGEEVVFLMSLLAILAIEIPLAIFLRSYHGEWIYAVLAPLGIITGAWIATWLFFTKVFNIGVEWRGSVYKRDFGRRT